MKEGAGRRSLHEGSRSGSGEECVREVDTPSDDLGDGPGPVEDGRAEVEVGPQRPKSSQRPVTDPGNSEQGVLVVRVRRSGETGKVDPSAVTGPLSTLLSPRCYGEYTKTVNWTGTPIHSPSTFVPRRHLTSYLPWEIPRTGGGRGSRVGCEPRRVQTDTRPQRVTRPSSKVGVSVWGSETK